MRLMHISHKEADATPLQLVVKHLEYYDIENQIKQQKQEQANGN